MKTMTQVVKAIVRDEGPKAFFKGLPATCLSISPYSALNFCAFDLFKKIVPSRARRASPRRVLRGDAAGVRDVLPAGHHPQARCS